MQLPKASDEAKALFADRWSPMSPGRRGEAHVRQPRRVRERQHVRGAVRRSIGVRVLDDARRAELAAIDGAGPFGPEERPMGGYVAAPAAWSGEPERLAGWVAVAFEEVGAAAEGAEGAEVREDPEAHDELSVLRRRAAAQPSRDSSTAIAALWPPMPLTAPPRTRARSAQQDARDAASRRPSARPASRAARRPRPTATTAARGRCCRRACAAPPRGRAWSSSRCRGGPRHPSRSRRRSARRAPSRASRARRPAGARAARRCRTARRSRCGTCRPKTVSVCAPDAASSGARIDGSVSEWQ